VITPSKSNTAYPDIKAKFVNKAFNENGVKVKVTVDGKTKVLESNIK
jgi:heparan-sulfate lyase